MGLELTIAATLVVAGILLLAARLNARRGLHGVALIPWDYVMILCAILLVACLAHLAILWRDQQLF